MDIKKSDMQRRFFTMLTMTLFLFLLNNLTAQRLTKYEGKRIAENTFRYLNQNDTSSFISLWFLTYVNPGSCDKELGIPPYYAGTVIMSKEGAKKEFIALKEFIGDTPIDIHSIHIRTTKLPINYEYKYGVTNKISCDIKFDKGIKKVIFYTLQYDEKWFFKLSTETSFKSK